MIEEKESKALGNNWTLVLPIGALSLLGALMLSVANEAAVALRLAEQHGESLLLLREEVRLMRRDLNESAQLSYTSIDAQRDLEYIKRDISELKQAIKELDRD
jgi:hypothetical protein